MDLVKKLGVLVLGLGIAVTALAEEVYITSASSGFDIYLMDDRVKDTYHDRSKVKSVWVKWVVVNDLVQDGLGVGDYTIENWYIKCDDLKYSLIKSYDYKKSKTGGFENIDSYTQPSYGYTSSYNFKEAIPQTNGESIVKFVCDSY